MRYIRLTVLLSDIIQMQNMRTFKLYEESEVKSGRFCNEMIMFL